ncbi:MAG TPA: FkbM family methyltransferase [Vicinamibacterales bacterium]|nr:FkbM family methyltransferase [Vicinamibacterales bacterium]
MRFDDPAWRQAPLRTGLRVATSLVRRSLPGTTTRVAVPYDDGRSLIYADLHTPLGLQLYRFGHHDPNLTLVRRLLSPGDVFVDGGANIGLFTLVAAQRVGAQGKVIAYEPGRVSRMRLMENVVQNQMSQVDVMPFAPSSAAGEAATIDATVVGADLRRLVLMKLYLDGAEYAALRGAEEVLHAVHPDLIIEVDQPHLALMGSSAEEVMGLLRAHDYELYRLQSDDGSLSLVPAAEPGAAAAAHSPHVFATVDPERVRSHGLLVR